MDFTDFSWDYCLDSSYDFTKHKYVWCEIKNESCKKSICPKIHQYYQILIDVYFEEMLKDSNQIKKFQKENGLIVDGIPGPEVINKINEIIKKEKLYNENLY